MKKLSLAWLQILILTLPLGLFAQKHYHYSGNWGNAGFNIEKQDAKGIQVVFSVPEFSISNFQVNGKTMQSVELSGVYLPNNAGAPNIPGTARYICIPQDALPTLEIVAVRTETVAGVEIAPAPRIPKETETGLEYPVNEEIYHTNAFYPSQIVLMSEPEKIRGIDVIKLGFSPFQYNPVTKELKVYKDIRVNIKYKEGKATFGDQRLRSRWFDPLLQDMLLNPEVLPAVDYNKTLVDNDDTGFEYLIIVPDDSYFSTWADSIKLFRQKQGIITGIKTLSEIGGNDWSIIESYLNNAYSNWDIPPVACLLIGDYGQNINNTIDSPIWDGYCVSDNIYADVDGNSMPDIIMARMTAQNEDQLRVMVRKFIDYERNPPTNPGFYAHPISALGWQSDRWFQICSEVIRGYWQNVLGKTPVRINAVNTGNPTVDPWSSATNTGDVLNYFGPNGLGYIPATPQDLGGFTGGTAAQINTALNDGAFMLQHRDHGGEDGWGEPAYYNSDIDGLVNTDLSYIMSVNCLTGKYNSSSEVFAEKFHRYTFENQPAGALGILAASETSYSFVNDAYIWGGYDNMWPSFMPAYGSTPAERGILPAFSNAAGKYFLEQSSWPYNTSEKEVTYNLFHHHGDAFLTVYSEIPQTLTVTHDETILTGVTTFAVTANPGALICLSLNGEILGTAMGTGFPVPVTIPGNQVPPDIIDVVVTLQNYNRYEGSVNVIPPAGPYVVKNLFTLNDSNSNGNGLMDYGENINLNFALKNVGSIQADSVTATLSTLDPYIAITSGTADYGSIPADSVILLNDAFSFVVANDIPDNHTAYFTVNASDGVNTWPSHFSVKAHAPALSYVAFAVSDSLGNNNGKIEAGETVTLKVTVKNTGSAEAMNVEGLLTTSDTNVMVDSGNSLYGNINAAGVGNALFTITADSAAPIGHSVIFNLSLTANLGITGSGSFTAVIGQIPILIIDLEPLHNSGTVMNTAIQQLGLSADYMTQFPADLNVYSSIFVCLGIFNDNEVLSNGQGMQLKNYLDNGGRLYMEGGDTWYYDGQTPVHSYFNIASSQDGNGDLSTLKGQAGTITEGMTFIYDGENSYIDRLNPVSGSTAFKIFQNQSPSYGTGIAYDGGNYKTIGCSHEFGGLNEGTNPSTKTNLMYQYLSFFGIVPEALSAGFSCSNTQVCLDGQVTFTDNSAGEPSSWQWLFPGGNPETSVLQNPTVSYSGLGSWDVSLIVTKGTEADTVVKEDYISVITPPQLTSMPTGPAEICNNASSTLFSTMPIPGATTYAWALIPPEAGIINGNTTSATVYWYANYIGQAAVTVQGINSCGAGPVSPEYTVTLNPLPSVALEDFSNVCINWPAFLLTGGSPGGGSYSGFGVINGYFYPANAFIGNNPITYSYTDSNACTAFVTKNLYVDACTSIPSLTDEGINIELMPNPAHDVLSLKLTGAATQTLKLKIINILGEIVWEKSLITSLSEYEEKISLSPWPDGIYMLNLESGSSTLIKKFIIE